MTLFNEDFVPLTPVNFFALGLTCYHKGYEDRELPSRYTLPETSSLTGEKPFAEVAMAWDYEGIMVNIRVDSPCTQVSFPEVTEGDSIELFFDTRDVKTSGFNTRFCHHFYFLPQKVEGQQAGEITHFRSEEDRHELCDPSLLKVIATLKRSSYTMRIFIPAQCLVGYDPEQFNRIGFTYRINRYNDTPQHLSAVTEDYQIAQQPSLWSSVTLVAS